MSASNESSDERLLGQVKWFNNQLNYGFVTVISEGQHNGVDVFVHQTSINPIVSNYRTLTQGEYIEFIITTNDGDKHPYHATEVTGIQRGKLMCDFYNPQSRRGNHSETNGGNSYGGGGSRNNSGGNSRGQRRTNNQSHGREESQNSS